MVIKKRFPYHSKSGNGDLKRALIYPTHLETQANYIRGNMYIITGALQLVLQNGIVIIPGSLAPPEALARQFLKAEPQFPELRLQRLLLCRLSSRNAPKRQAKGKTHNFMFLHGSWFGGARPHSPVVPCELCGYQQEASLILRQALVLDSKCGIA